MRRTDCFSRCGVVSNHDLGEDRDELNALAGEYVLGVLDPGEAREIAAALTTNGALRNAVAFWEAQLHPLAALAAPAEPPADLWNRIAGRLDETSQPSAARWWNRPAPWRWATSGLAAVAAALLLYITLDGSPAAPNYVAVLHAPQLQDQGELGRDGRPRRPDHSHRRGGEPGRPAVSSELWAIAPRSTTSRKRSA